MEELIVEKDKIIDMPFNVSEDKLNSLIKSDTDDKMCRRYMITYNNPTQTDEEFYNYISSLEHIKYFIFQREKGHLTGTEHIHAFVVFNVGKRFSTMRNYFPDIHIDKVKGTNSQCRDYCSKSDTRIGQVMEYGEFAEERSRTDYKDFLELVQNGTSEIELSRLFPTLFLKHVGQLEKIRESYRHEVECDKFRDVEVTYIYGPPRTGKTYSVINKYGMKNVHLVRIYGTGMFDSYRGEDVLCLDEFDSQIKITEMNAILDTYALEFKARFYNRQASFTKVYIISNLPLSKLYVDEQITKPEIYKAFLARIKTIIHFDSQGVQHIEKSNVALQYIKIEENIFKDVENENKSV